MKKLPKVRTAPAAAWQRQRLERWLQEWQVDRLLPETTAEEPAPSRGRAGPAQTPDRSRWSPRYSTSSPVASADRDRPVVAGQIRLLRPVSEPARQRLLYVAVLQAEPDGSFLAAPFGRFAEPATPGEWLTGRSQPGWRVLCLWNARIFPADLALQSWLVDHLTDAETEQALAIWRQQTAGTELPVELVRSVGPPVVHPLDPRRQYLEDEKLALDLVVSATSSPADTGFGDAVSGELALAAESRGVYEAVTRFQVGDSPLVLEASTDSDPTRRQVTVIDETGRPSTQLDGLVLRAADGSQSEPIARGKVVIPAGMLAPGLVLASPDGTTRRLQPLP